MRDLSEIYDSLSSPQGSGDLYAARRLDDRPNYHVARDSSGNPSLLISSAPAEAPAPPPVELRNLSFRPRCACRIVQSDGSVRTESLAVLKCVSDDAVLRDYFVRVLAGTLRSLPSTPEEHEISRAVRRLAELFRALDAPPRGSLQGIWCELLLIARADRVRQAVAAWHADPAARHDFLAGRQRLEVKSTTGRIRAHHFSLEQLRTGEDAQVIVMSFLLEEDPQGLSIRELWSAVAERPELTDDGRDRVAHVLALSLGRDWHEATTTRFNADHAWENLRVYDAALVPCVSPDLPVGVDEVRFRAELTDVPHLSRAAVAQRGGLLAAMLSR